MIALRAEILSLREKWRDQPQEPFYDELSDLLFKAGKITAAMNLMEASHRVPQAEPSPQDDRDRRVRELHQDDQDDRFPGNNHESDCAWWFRRGMEYADACLFEEASACLNRALAAGGENFETHYCLAGIYKSLERPDQAESHCRASLRHNPGFAPTFLLLASVMRMTGRVAESADAARMAVFLDPDCAPAHYDLACYYALAGEPAKALAALGTALDKGFCDFEWAGRDPDLEGVRHRPEFKHLLDAYTADPEA